MKSKFLQIRLAILKCLSCWLILLGIPSNVSAKDVDDDFFESRIRPLLIEHCLECHGATKQESGLRLDSRDGWLQGGDRGVSIVPGKPIDSLLIRSIRYDDPDLRMPPDGKRLLDAQISDLVAWVERGAHDPRNTDTNHLASSRMSLEAAGDFWAFQPIQSPAEPEVQQHGWIKNPIDTFILSELESRHIVPVGEADKRTLIRRATFDLTGLPPTLNQIKDFLSDDSPDAFATLVNRLLESPAYGERWGRHWLDVARYADTAGDGADYPVREAGKYRDWVVNALNADKPFDQFVREQIAGDILASTGPADEYADRVTATGFLAIGKRYGYKPSPDYQHLDFADAIDSVGRSLLGLSLGCARCHDHKYDPVSAADYYALYGILQSTQWAFPGGEELKRPAYFPPLVPPDEAKLRDQAKTDQVARIDDELTRVKLERAELEPLWFAGGKDLAFEGQQIGQPPSDPWIHGGPIEVSENSQSPFFHVHPSGTRGIHIGSGQPTDGLRYVFPFGLHAEPGKQIYFSVDFRIASDAKQPGAFRFYLGQGVIQSLAVQCSVTATEFAIGNGANWEVIREVAAGTWYTLQLLIDPETKTYSGIIGTIDDLTAFQDKEVGPGWNGIADTFICDGIGHVDGPACARDIDNLGLQETAFADPGSGPVLPRDDLPDTKRRIVALDTKIAALGQQRKSIAEKPAYPVAYGVSEGTPVNTRIQQRGEPERLGDEVPRRFLEVLGGDLVSQEPPGSGRLDLANWISEPTNPLTARVFVNRVWQWHFGQGLVITPSDFGARGAPPSHPQLLDHLASQFIASGWSVKSLHRLIMQSRTYQLASEQNDSNLQIDPDNQWHWRYSRRPLDAESIRDAMLAVSGQLDRSIPDSHPFPPVDTWAFTIHQPFHAVYQSNHRSLYLMVQRNRRHPFLALFDAADPNQSVELRKPTTTPTQALYLMNSPFVHEQAEAFAKIFLSTGGDDATRLAQAYETAHGRVPTETELNEFKEFLNTYQMQLRDQQTSIDQNELLAWSALARVLLTSNAFLFVD